MIKFYQYVRSFYGKDGLYPMGATVPDIVAATKILIDAVGDAFEGDALQARGESVRDKIAHDRTRRHSEAGDAEIGERGMHELSRV